MTLTNQRKHEQNNLWVAFRAQTAANHPMAIKFATAEKRDELARRLVTIAYTMHDAMSQGGNNQISVSPEMAGDILTAAGAVKFSEIDE